MRNRLSNAIHVRVSDGLGNQLFQYAAGRALAARNHAPLVLEPIPEFFKWINPSRRFALNHFNLGDSVRIVYPGMISRILGKRLSKSEPVPRFKEANAYQFQKEVFEINPPVRLEGFFQSLDYFKDLQPQGLARELSLKNELSKKAKALRNRILNSSNSVCVHLRLGDYKSSEIFYSLNEAYYQEAINTLCTQIPGKPSFWVFSNGEKQEVEALCMRSGIVNAEIEIDQKIPEWELLHVMASCSHHVIANSTFSWWSAWLKSSSGVTIMPKRWFQESSWEVSGLRVSGWFQV